MTTYIPTRITAKGLLIPHSAIREWLNRGVEVVKNEERIIIQPLPSPRSGRDRVVQILANTGLLVKTKWETSTPPVSQDEFKELADKFSQGAPLSEIAIEEREAGW
ncbi:MAG: hypothetical protein KKD28_11905 [Chloroflexi bacterium]|nr:hypothetical protein [Chloroflexota bacterium]